MEVANYILQIFRNYITIVWSWGFNTPIAVENGLRFFVEGYIHQGAVEVIYDEGYDLFSIRLLNSDGSIKHIEEGVYLDGLVDVIDGLVERCENYAQRVKKDYGIANR